MKAESVQCGLRMNMTLTGRSKLAVSWQKPHFGKPTFPKPGCFFVPQKLLQLLLLHCCFFICAATCSVCVRAFVVFLVLKGFPLWLETSVTTLSLWSNSLLQIWTPPILPTHWIWPVSVNAVCLVGCMQCNLLASCALSVRLSVPYLTLLYLPHPSVRVPLASKGIPFLNKSIQLINTAEPFTPFGAQCKTAAFSGSRRHLKTGAGYCKRTKNIWEMWILCSICVELWNEVRLRLVES